MPGRLSKFKKYLDANTPGSVVDFNKGIDKLYPFDFTSNNKELNQDILEDTEQFSCWITDKLKTNNCRYGIGGYNEHRTIYSRSNLFDASEEPRRLHLGTDIWGSVGTKIFCPFAGTVHSFNFNNNFGDYGATIILTHELEGLMLHTLYGHLSLASISGLWEGKEIAKGQYFADFGPPAENGYWPPHLHFQLIFDIGNYHGDYPGVCAYSQREIWLKNSPDPALILNSTFT